MMLRKRFRSLFAAVFMAVTIVSVATGAVHAIGTPLDQVVCEADGGIWDYGVGRCAKLHCQFGGQNYDHGQTVTVLGKTWTCNGFTGRWDIPRTAEPQTPTAPRPTTNRR